MRNQGPVSLSHADHKVPETSSWLLGHPRLSVQKLVGVGAFAQSLQRRCNPLALFVHCLCHPGTWKHRLLYLPD